MPTTRLPHHLPEEPEGGNFTNRIKDSLQYFIVAGIAAIALLALQSSKEIAVLQNMVMNMQGQLNDVKNSSANRYTSYDAEKDLRSRDDSIKHNASEIEMLNKRMQEVEMQIIQKHK